MMMMFNLIGAQKSKRILLSLFSVDDDDIFYARAFSSFKLSH